MDAAGISSPIVLGSMSLRLQGMPSHEETDGWLDLMPGNMNIYVPDAPSAKRAMGALAALGVRRSKNRSLFPADLSLPDLVGEFELRRHEDALSPFGQSSHTSTVVTDAGPVKLQGFVGGQGFKGQQRIALSPAAVADVAPEIDVEGIPTFRAFSVSAQIDYLKSLRTGDVDDLDLSRPDPVTVLRMAELIEAERRLLRLPSVGAQIDSDLIEMIDLASRDERTPE
jgi:hypothetical protein